MPNHDLPAGTQRSDAITKGYRLLLIATTIVVFLLIVGGGILRANTSDGACPDWPTCFGAITPPAGEYAMLDYLHRLATLISVVLLGTASLIAWRRYREEKFIFYPLLFALALVAVQVGLGAFLSRLIGISWMSAAHLGLSLLVLGLLLVAVIATLFRSYLYDLDDQPELHATFRSPFSRLALVNVVVVFSLLVSGAVVAGSGSSQLCASWPLCAGALSSWQAGEWINTVHRVIVLLAAALVGWMVLQAWRSQRTQTPVIVAASAAAVLFYAQALLGSKLVDGYPSYLLVLHQATAVAVWAALLITAACAGFAGRTVEQERQEAQEVKGRKGLSRDLLMLTKPIVVILLLVTTFAGMVIGAKAWPSLSLTFWTLLGGFLAAGGSGAINQYIDRKDDQKMQRTQKRPIPSGRLTPGEGLAFGVAIALASFFLMVAFVNFLAALLSLAGIIYYVLIYSIFLKKTTVQNIVIGGGAGAIPPLVGWAAATGSLNLPALFLFAVVFMWTPPHFWALALVRRNDYARAGVPMLPVVRGEKETRWQIFIYTLELVGLTLFLPLFGLGGSIYFIGAFMLGVWLLLYAWKVWKKGGNKLAWKMYRYSSMYLAFIFIVLMVDALI
jgi:protoheme IX farnesyltransferase